MNDSLISRENLKMAINTYDKFACLPSGKLEPFRNLEHSEMFEPYVHLRDIRNAIDNASTVESKRLRGKWIDNTNGGLRQFRCSNCGHTIFCTKEGLFYYKGCYCGALMERNEEE